jgi:superfamily II DNA or RNA helicase
MAILESVRKATRSDVWSRGVRLVRQGRVVAVSQDADEAVFQVIPPGSSRPCTVHLWPEDPDWSCDCAARLRPCQHIAAAAIMGKHGAEGVGDNPSPIPAAQVATVAYRFSRAERGLHLDRVVVSPDGEAPLEGTLSGRHTGPEMLAFGDPDLEAEKAVAQRFGMVVPRERMPRLLRALAECKDVTIDGTPIAGCSTPVVPHGWVEDHGEGFRLRIVRDPSIVEVFANGAVRCEDGLHAISGGDLSREQRTVLARGVEFSVDEVGQLVAEVLPRLKEKIPVHVRTKRLPKVDASPPRMVLETRRQGETLLIKPVVVYGDPPLAKVSHGSIEILGGIVPIRNERAEQRLIHNLGNKLRMAIGVETRLKGMAAVRFVDRLDQLPIDLIGTGHRHFRRVQAIEPEVQIDGDRLDISMGGANPEEVIHAWMMGEELVSLPDGGWAPLPMDWLAEHGHRLADLLSARDETGKVARYALFDLARLCEALDHPPPPGLEGIRRLIDGFDGIAPADLPEGFTGELRSYQAEGVAWLSFLKQAGMGGVLADDMGLGKTIQALCLISDRTLVVAPRSVLHNWEEEAARFRPDLKVHIYHGPQRKLDETADLTITTYALMRGDAKRMQEIQWSMVILDEAQAIKNPESQVSQAAFGLRADFRITLTGTPVENRLDELWSQMHYVNPGLLGGRRDFDERYSQAISRGDSGAAGRLRERIRPFILRRLKREVAPELPPRTDLVLRCNLSEAERAVYDTVRMATQQKVVAEMGKTNVMVALEALLRLRQASCHSGLVPGQTAEGSAKITLLMDTLDAVVAEGHKALVFSQWTALLDRVEPHLHAAGHPFIRLDGSTRDRRGVVNTFQSDDGPPVMLISLKAGGTGLNLTAADHVFLLDPWWNPAVEDQAADRTHRIGQDKPVLVYRLVAEDTVEERILKLQVKKRAIADAALGEADQAAGITREDLLALLAD